MKDFLENCKFGVLRAQFTAREGYFKKMMHHLHYFGQKIHHYTDLSGLIGIVENRGFWLSEAKFLNDSEELHNGVNLSIGIIEKLYVKKRYELFRPVLEKTKSSLKSLQFSNYFVASFSLRPDSLEQWRAYGKNGTGVCIEFDIKKNTEYPHFTAIPRYILSKVIYSNNIKTYIIISIINKYFSEFKKDLIDPSKINNEDYAESLASSLAVNFINFKNSAFESEAEVRIVDTGQIVNFYKNKNHRVSNGLIVPYVCTYDTNLKNTEGPICPDALPITAVIVGPVTQQDAKIQSIKEFMQHYGYSPEIVTRSKLPYRG